MEPVRLRGLKTRREMLGMIGVGAGLAALYPLLDTGRAGALLASPPTFPGQVGSAVRYVTPKGTACWMLHAYAGTAGNPNDDYHYAKVIVPQSLDVNVATPTVLVVHGATATEECLTNGGGATVLAQSWLDLGWAVIATREGSTINPKTGNEKLGRWGNEGSRQGMADAWRWATTAWTPDPHGFLVLGFSMGGVGGLNFVAEAQRQHLPVAAMYAVDGATNLAYCCAHNTSFKTNAQAAYGLPKKFVVGDASWIAKVDVADGGHDPQKVVPHLRPFPLRMSASANDPTVNKPNNAALLYNTLATAGWGAELGLLNYVGGHCAKKHFVPTDVNPFFARAIARADQAPHAVFTYTIDDTTVSFDASGSTDADGFVVGYAWDFGDGNTATGPTVQHDFGATGTFTVVLSVTDERGGTGTKGASISVTAPNSPPVAAFSFLANGTVVDFDASSSTDPDGAGDIASYAWDYGDGGTDVGVSTEHDFGITGSFAVRLIVTDQAGATNSTTQTVSVTAPDPDPGN